MHSEKALLGAGCFWGVAHLLKDIPGVQKVEVGFAGGVFPRPSYEMVCTGATGHAEVVMIEFDPMVLKYSQLLDVFFRLHDPTTLNRQHNDIGTQYRSVIFTFSEEQQQTAKNMILDMNNRKVFKSPVVTEVEPYSNYFKAEDYHQDYLIKNPGGYMCHVLRDQL